MELITLKRICVLLGSAKLLCARTQQCFVRHLGQCICQGSAFPCVLLCSFVHLHQCILWACIGKPVRSAIFCCPHERGSLLLHGSAILPSSIVSGIFMSHPWFYCWWCWPLAFPLFLVGFSASSPTWLLALGTLWTIIIWQPCWIPPTSLLSLFWRFLPLLSPVLNLFLCLQLSQLFCFSSMISHRPFLRL